MDLQTPHRRRTTQVVLLVVSSLAVAVLIALSVLGMLDASS